MSAVSIHIVGLGVAEQAQLTPDILSILQKSDFVIGWARHKPIIDSLIEPDRFVEVTKLTELKTLIDGMSDSGNPNQVISVVASGDPLHYGIGRWFTHNFPIEQLQFHPAISSIQTACHKQGLSVQDVNVVSLHGRPLATIRTKLKRNSTLVILTDKNSQPQALANECIALGFGQSTITVHENLGYSQETSTTFEVHALSDTDKSFDPLHVSIIQVKGVGGVMPEFPGIPDHHYITGAEPGKGMISKREVRLAILSLIQPANGDVIWDIGAGCGGVAIELAYWNDRVAVHAVECHEERLGYLQQNQNHFGVLRNLTVIEGSAPEILYGLPAPNKVFIGGSNGVLSVLLNTAWASLPEGGLLVACGVMESTMEQLKLFAESLPVGNVESVRLSVKRGSIENYTLSYTSKLPVEVFKFVKGDVHS